MIKLLIADDEPLVCVGLQSMLKWENYGIEIVGTARNGGQAADMIEEHRPDIVITDIKMPIKTGLELAEECGKKYGRLPLFIILTSYEEFDLVRKAIAFQAVDYLIKLELEPAALDASITKALSILREEKREDAEDVGMGRGSIQSLREKFFIRLFNNLFESEEQYRLQAQDLGLELGEPGYLVGFFEITSPGLPPNGKKLASLCASSVQMARETLNKYIPCYVLAMDMRHFAVAFRLDERALVGWRPGVEEAVGQTTALLRNYFNVQLVGALGRVVREPLHMSAGYHSARRAFGGASEARPLLFFDDLPTQETGASESYLIGLRKKIRKAFEEFDPAALHESLTAVAAELAARPDALTEAMDTACNILYMAFSLLPESDTLLWEIFKDNPEGYRTIYHLGSVDAITAWLYTLRDGCCEKMRAGRQSYKQQLVASVKSYIGQNLDKKLTLHEVAAVFNFSPNYLSQLFAKNNDTGFVEYITAARIAAARDMLARGEGKIYEIAERLGFESAFYFSKVFKKVEGISPREYLQRLHGEAPPDETEEEDA